MGMGNSGKLAVISAVVAGALLALAAVTLEEWVLFLFFGAVLTVYLASLWQVVVRRRYVVLAVAFLGSTLFIAFGIAFLRMWGLAFTLTENSLGSAVSSKDSDIYFYLSIAAGAGALLLLFAGAVWPSRRPRASRPPRKTAQRPSGKAATPVRRPAGKTTPARRPAAKVPQAPARRPASGSAPQRKAAPASRPVPRRKS